MLCISKDQFAALCKRSTVIANHRGVHSSRPSPSSVGAAAQDKEEDRRTHNHHRKRCYTAAGHAVRSCYVSDGPWWPLWLINVWSHGGLTTMHWLALLHRCTPGHGLDMHMRHTAWGPAAIAHLVRASTLGQEKDSMKGRDSMTVRGSMKGKGSTLQHRHGVFVHLAACK